MKNKDKILEIIKTRNIIQIIHFTKKQNIGSIIKNGLLSINELKNKYIKKQHQYMMLFKVLLGCSNIETFKKV